MVHGEVPAAIKSFHFTFTTAAPEGVLEDLQRSGEAVLPAADTEPVAFAQLEENRERSLSVPAELGNRLEESKAPDSPRIKREGLPTQEPHLEAFEGHEAWRGNSLFRDINGAEVERRLSANLANRGEKVQCHDGAEPVHSKIRRISSRILSISQRGVWSSFTDSCDYAVLLYLLDLNFAEYRKSKGAEIRNNEALCYEVWCAECFCAPLIGQEDQDEWRVMCPFALKAGRRWQEWCSIVSRDSFGANQGALLVLSLFFTTEDMLALDDNSFQYAKNYVTEYMHWFKELARLLNPWAVVMNSGQLDGNQTRTLLGEMHHLMEQYSV